MFCGGGGVVCGIDPFNPNLCRRDPERCRRECGTRKTLGEPVDPAPSLRVSCIQSTLTDNFGGWWGRVGQNPREKEGAVLDGLGSTFEDTGHLSGTDVIPVSYSLSPSVSNHPTPSFFDGPSPPSPRFPFIAITPLSTGPG